MIQVRVSPAQFAAISDFVARNEGIVPDEVFLHGIRELLPVSDFEFMVIKRFGAELIVDCKFTDDKKSPP